MFQRTDDGCWTGDVGRAGLFVTAKVVGTAILAGVNADKRLEVGGAARLAALGHRAPDTPRGTDGLNYLKCNYEALLS